MSERHKAPRTLVKVNGLIIELARPALNLLSLKHEGRHWLRCPAEGQSLWSLLAVDEAGRRAKLTTANCRTAAVKQEEGAASLTWRGVRDKATGAGPFDVIVEIRPAGGCQGVTAWRIRVHNRAKAWTLWSVEFPRLEGLQPSANLDADRLFYSDCWGAEWRGDKMHPLNLRYPRGIKITMQFLGYSRGQQTFYLGTHDSGLTTKDFLFSPPRKARPAITPGRFAVLNYPEQMSVGGNGFAPDYDTVVAVLDGDWYDAAGLYAAWARRQPWATAPPPAASRRPRAEREVHAWLTMHLPQKPMDQWADQAERLAKLLGVRLGVHFYNWHQIPFDVNYPEYFPARDGFRRLVGRLRRAGIATMPYINARLWDVNAPSWRRRGALRFAAKQSAERLNPQTLLPYIEEYGSGAKLAPMCPTTAFWRRTVIELCRRITTELGCDGVYLDQVGAERAELCFDASHGHPLGGGGYWLEGYRRLMRDLRETIGPGPILTTEANWEGCAADYDTLLSYHRFGDEMVPMFPAVYAGLARTFGCAFSPRHIAEEGGEPFARRMGMLLAWGGQLGWGDLTPLLEAKNRPVRDYFASLCRTRAAHVELFADGRMLRPPSVAVARGGRPPSAGRYPLYCSVWQSGSADRTALFLVNPSRRRLRATVRLTDDACRGLAPAPTEGITSRHRRKGPATFTVLMPPFGVRAVALQ